MFRNEDEARIALTTGTATPEDLNEIVTSYPQLRTTVAAYPATYPALVDWLANLHDPAVNQALAAPSTVNLQDADIDATTLQKLAATRLELDRDSSTPELLSRTRHMDGRAAKRGLCKDLRHD